MNLSDTFEVKRTSKLTTNDYALLFGLLMGVVLLLVSGSATSHQPSAAGSRIVIVGAVVLAAVLLWTVSRRSRKGPVLFLTPAGLRYLPMSTETIPWTVITRISARRGGAYRFMTLTLDPVFRQSFKLGIARRANAALGDQTLGVPVHRLDITLDDLVAAAEAYRNAARQRLDVSRS